jgi:hypothetical protein
MPRSLPALVAAAALLPNPTTVVADANQHVNVNVLLTPASYSGCSDSSFDWIEQSLCFGLNSSPIAGPALAWVVASEPTGFPGGIASIQFGVEHDASVGSWTSCTGGLEIAEPGWPASGTGNALTWDDCVSDTGGNVRVGYFFLSAGDVGTIQVVGDPRQGSQAAYTNCNVEAVGICRANLGTLDLADPDPPVCADVPGPPPNAATDCVAIGDVCRVTVDWLHDGTDVVGFDVLRDGVVIDDVGPSERTYVDTLAPPGVTSLYEVVARNHCADATPSNTASAVLITDAVPATHVSASYGECEAVHVTWDHPGGANGFKILRDGVDVHQVTGGQRQYYDFDGPADTEVHYTIVAFGCADAPPSAPALGHRLGNPPAPSWVDASHECPKRRVVRRYRSHTGRTRGLRGAGDERVRGLLHERARVHPLRCTACSFRSVHHRSLCSVCRHRVVGPRGDRGRVRHCPRWS